LGFSRNLGIGQRPYRRDRRTSRAAFALYQHVGKEFASHKTALTVGAVVSPVGQTTNNAETFFCVFKRDMPETYTFCGEQHLGRYVREFQFRYDKSLGLGVRGTDDNCFQGYRGQAPNAAD
jgi:hypothetical protein